MRYLTLILSLWFAATAFAQSADEPEAPQEQPAEQAAEQPAAQIDLSNLQRQIFRDYERFEKSLYDIAEQARGKDPERAELLYRARSQSQEKRILRDMEVISELLRPSGEEGGAQYGSAVDRQKELIERLEIVLKLLQSLDERERIGAEIKRIEELLKDTNILISREKDVQADTLRGRDLDRMKQAQEKVAEEARKLAEKIDEQDRQRREDEQDRRSEDAESESDQQDGMESDAPSEADSDSKGDSQSEGDAKSESESDSESEGKPDSESQDPSEKPSDASESDSDSPSDADASPSDQQPQEAQESQDGSPDSSSQDSQPDQSPESQQTPGREELEQARRQMQQAIEKLEQQQREGAVEDQEEAVAKLEELKAKLEEILRQLREEERESYLTLLEARFQNMLKRQQRINTETIRLDAIPEGDRPQQNYASQTDNIRKEQNDNAIEAEKALNLLLQEGSSVAFPEAVEQMHKNMLVVVNRLGNHDTGQTTQLVEQLIVETLEEMIDAFQKELDKDKSEQQEGQPGQQGQPQDPSLVDQIAELKMIRSLQNQINRLTVQIGTELEGEIATDPDQLQLIEDLARRQKRVQEATYDLSVGRNR
jgi:hypothetical protein